MPKQKRHTATFKASDFSDAQGRKNGGTNCVRTQHSSGATPPVEATSAGKLPPSVYGKCRASSTNAGARGHVDRTLCPNRQIDHPTRVAQKNLASTLSRDERVALIDGDPDGLPLTVQTDLPKLRALRLWRSETPDGSASGRGTRGHPPATSGRHLSAPPGSPGVHS